MAHQDQPYKKVEHPLHKIMVNNFVGGIFWALGITIGFSLLIALLGLLSKYINVVPFIGTFISDIIDFVLSYNRNLR